MLVFDPPSPSLRFSFISLVHSITSLSHHSCACLSGSCLEVSVMHERFANIKNDSSLLLVMRHLHIMYISMKSCCRGHPLEVSFYERIEY